MKNALIISTLKKLEQQANVRGEVYRAKAFKYAYTTISKLEFEIKVIDQIKGIEGFGKGTLSRISEIISEGKLNEVDDISKKDKIIEQFISINGVGFKTAEKWYKKGYRTIDDLLTKESKNLTESQKIGIKYKDELSLKIPRETIDEIIVLIIQTIQEINKEKNVDLISLIAGSYRRGKRESGDIDCIVSEKNGQLDKSHITLFLYKLEEIKLLTDNISLGPSKYMGICRDQRGIHRRIDFEFVYDYDNFVYELLYFTGSQETNILMRRAAKKMGMVLNQHGLYKGGKLLKANSEKEIFSLLKMEYLDPEDRWILM